MYVWSALDPRRVARSSSQRRPQVTALRPDLIAGGLLDPDFGALLSAAESVLGQETLVDAQVCARCYG